FLVSSLLQVPDPGSLSLPGQGKPAPFPAHGGRPDSPIRGTVPEPVFRLFLRAGISLRALQGMKLNFVFAGRQEPGRIGAKDRIAEPFEEIPAPRHYGAPRRLSPRSLFRREIPQM